MQADGAISQPLLINQERKRYACFFSKEPGISPIAETYGSYTCAPVANCLLVFAQLRDMLPAENSSVVAQEHDYSWISLPKRTKPDLATFGVRQENVR